MKIKFDKKAELLNETFGINNERANKILQKIDELYNGLPRIAYMEDLFEEVFNNIDFENEQELAFGVSIATALGIESYRLRREEFSRLQSETIRKMGDVHKMNFEETWGERDK